ncbi:Oxysterol-binding protein OBPa [Cystobasidiomycetes sp. EMM_F5]
MGKLGGIVKVNNEANHIHCDVEFKTKGFFTGTYNTIQGKVKSSSGEIGEVSGKWSDQIYFARGRSHHSSDKELLFDAHKAVAVKQIIAPMSEQQDNESPKLWSKVTEAIKHNDQDAATEHKSAIEDRQRELAKMREDSEEHFKPKYFALKNGEYRPIFT